MRPYEVAEKAIQFNTHRERHLMAKALLGYSIGTDPRVVNRLAGENRLLRQRVADLEEMVVRLQQENDALAALVTENVDEAVARETSRDGTLAPT